MCESLASSAGAEQLWERSSKAPEASSTAQHRLAPEGKEGGWEGGSSGCFPTSMARRSRHPVPATAGGRGRPRLPGEQALCRSRRAVGWGEPELAAKHSSRNRCCSAAEEAAWLKPMCTGSSHRLKAGPSFIHAEHKLTPAQPREGAQDSSSTWLSPPAPGQRLQLK